MSYMTASQMDDLADFMVELEDAFLSAPSALDFDLEIKVKKWGENLGTIVQNTDGICFVPEGEAFKPYAAPAVPVDE